MAIQAIQNNIIQWQCLHKEDDDEPECGLMNSASLDEIVYHSVSSHESTKGAVLRLPLCTCGAATHLNVGFTVKELLKVVCTVVNEQGEITGYVLPYRYMHNLRLHAMLHERGSVPYPALLPMPPQSLLAHPTIAALDTEFFHSLWLAYGIMRERKLLAVPFTVYFQHLTKMPLTLPDTKQAQLS